MQIGHALLWLVLGLGTIGGWTTPLQARFTSCLGDYNAADVDSRMIVSEVYANIVDGQAATEQGLVGDGHDVLRVDLIGNVGSTVIGYDNSTNKLATLFTDTSTAHISVYESTTWLCNSLFPPELPYQYYPFNTTYCPLPSGPFAMNLSIPLYHSYALTTLRTQVRVVDTSLNALTTACYDIEFTPYREDGWYYRLLLYVPIAIAIGFWTVTWAARLATGWIVGSGVAEYGVKEGHHSSSRVSLPLGSKREATMRKWGTMIISGLSGERLSVSSALLRFVTPGLKDILYYLQFCTMLGMLAVNWPQFAYPILAQGAWADLVWNMTLVQGSDAGAERTNLYPSNYTAPSAFAGMMNDSTYPLYLDDDTFNPLLNLPEARDGLDSWAYAVGLRPQDVFGTCLVVFLCLTLGVTLISLLLWFLHGLFEYTLTTEMRRPPIRSSLHSSTQASLGGKEAYETRSYGWESEGPRLPTQASLAAAQHASAPSKLRKTWFRFRPKGEAGAFHAAALYGNLLRLILTFHLPITAFSMYQLASSSASIVSRVFAALAFAFISLAIPAGVLLKIHRTPTGKLYDATRTLLSLGPMYNVYIEKKQMFRAFAFGASLIEGIAVGAGQKSGLAQSVIFVLVELFMLIVPAIWYPWGEGASMGAPSAFIGIIRVACAVLVMLLSGSLDMGESTNDWIAYTVLILHAIVFVFFTLMLLTKLVEGLIRLFGEAHFDESTSPLDSGLFAAIMDLDCLNGVRGGKAAQRKRRKRGSRQLQRNVSAAGSLTTQMMLDRHSQGVPRQPVSEGNTPFLMSHHSYDSQRQQTSYFPGYQPPLGPPPLERHSSESRSDDPSASGHIMDAWRPSQPLPYIPSANGYAPAALTSPEGAPQDINRPFSINKAGRSDFQNPYDAQTPTPTRSLSPPALRIASPSKPTHTRQHSSSAIVERYDNSAPPSPRLGHNAPSLYPPGRDGIRPNNEGLRPPLLAIPKRRSLNNLKDDRSPDSTYSSTTTPKDKKSKRKLKSSGWFARSNDSPDSPAEESDDEPGPSRKRLPRPFEPAPSPLSEEKKGWKAALGLGRKKSMDEMAELARDENKARKAALAAASGSMFAGVEAPPTPSRGFVVNRKGGATRPGEGSPGQSPSAGAGQTENRSFKVKRMGQSQPVSTIPLAPPAGSPVKAPQSQSKNTVSVPKTQPEAPKKTFKVLGRGNTSPATEQETPKSSFVVNRPQVYRGNTNDTAGTAGSSKTDLGQISSPLSGLASGYPPNYFVPINDSSETSKRLSRGSGGTFGSMGYNNPEGK